ncbi:MAG: hypothetical protein ACR2RL_20195 [Gammaproteobacteria bacterium]
MRVVSILLVLSLGLAWVGYVTRPNDRALSNVLWFFSALFALTLIAAFYDLI